MRRAGGLVLALILAAAPAAGQVQMRTRPDRAGDVYRFVSETHFVQSDDAGRATQDNVQEFELTVLAVEPEGLKLRYVLRKAQLKDSAGESMGALVKAMTDQPLEFHIRRDGTLTQVEDWPAYRAMLLTKVDDALPASDGVRAMLHQRLNEAPLGVAGEMILSDVKLMNDMEPRGQVALGRLEGDHANTEMSVVTPGCVLKVSRGASKGATGSGQAIVSEAEVAVEDGRVLTLSMHRVTRASGGTQDETVTIRRLSAPPACVARR